MLTKTYRGQTKPVTHLSFRPIQGNGGSMVLLAGSNGRSAYYRATVEADQLLHTARVALSTLSRISEIDYKIVVCVDGKSFFL